MVLCYSLRRLDSPAGLGSRQLRRCAHKNGVGVSGVASVPWGGLGYDWQDALSDMANSDHDKMAKFLLYHGVAELRKRSLGFTLET